MNTVKNLIRTGMAIACLSILAAHAHDTPDIVEGKARVVVQFWSRLPVPRSMTLREVAQVMYPSAAWKDCGTIECGLLADATRNP